MSRALPSLIPARSRSRLAPLEIAAEALALFALIAVWTVIYCLACPLPARAAEVLATPALATKVLAKAPHASFWADLIPLAVVVAIVALLTVMALRKGRPYGDDGGEPLGDTTNWRDPR